MNAILSPQDQINMALALARQNTAAGRPHLAFGGIPMHPAIAAALAAAQRPHFLDGGGAGDGDGEGSSRSGGSSGGSDNGGDGHGNGGDSSGSSASGAGGGLGGFGGGSSDGYGGGSSGGVGGIGGIGGGNDGYGGGSSSSGSSSTSSGGGFSVGSSGSSGGYGSSSGSSSSEGYGGNSNSNASSGSAGGVGGMGGGSSDGYGGGSSGGTQTSGGFSSGAASGSDNGGVGGSVGSSEGSGVMGGAGLSGGAGYGSSSGSSSDVGSMGGSYGAPASGGFSSDGAPSTGGFGNFGSTPTANSNPSGIVGATPSSSMMSGMTAGQSMSNEASNSAGEAGEDGTGGLGGVSTSGAFNSFGPAPSSPYGSMANAQNAFGNSSVGDGTTGTTPSSVGASNPEGVSGLSPNGQMMGVMGMSGIDTGIASRTNVGTTGALNGPGAYGFSADKTPGFDNFNSAGSVTQSSLGQDGYTGGYGYGPQSAMNGNLGGPEGYAAGPEGTSPAVAGALAAAGQTDGAQSTAAEPGTPSALTVSALPAPGQPMDGLPDYGKPFTPDFSHWNNLVAGVDQTQHPGYTQYGANGPIGGPQAAAPAPAAPSDAPAASASPYGTMSQTPMGPALTGSLQNAMGDPSAVAGMSALTIHGPHTEAAQGAYDAPDTATPFGGITDQQAFNARQNAVVNGYASSQDSAVQAGYTAQQNAPPAVRTAGISPAVAGAMAAAAPANDGPAADASASASDAPEASQPDQVTSTTPGIPDGSYYAGVHKIEGGKLNGQVDPGNPTHYGPAQFSQATWSGVARNNPGLGLPSSMFSATPQQYAKATVALTQENANALQTAGLPATPANLYMTHNLGAPTAIAALKAGPNASLTAAGISSSIQAANPSIYGGVQTVGQAQARIAGMLNGAKGIASTPDAPSQPAITVHSIGAALGDGTAAQVGRYNGAGTGMDGIGSAGLGGLGGIGTMGTGDFGAAEAANTGKFGTITAHDYSVPGKGQSGMFGDAVTTAHDAPGVPAFAGMAGRYGIADGTISNEGMSLPASERGYTDFDGNPVDYGSAAAPDTSDQPTDTSQPTKHLSVPNWMGNGVAGIAAGSLLGPVGTALGIGNSISGFMGGPTAADGINAVLGSPGAPEGVTGGGDNSNASGREGPYNQPYVPQGSVGDGSGSGSGSGDGSSATTTGDTSNPASTTMPPLTIRRRHQYYDVGSPSVSFYNPLTDPAVARALAAMRT